jgi:ArsR family transcriptional regulator
MQDLVNVMKALSDETRLRIMNILLERDCCVCEVMQALDISQTRASRNLGILDDAGFLKAERDGVWVQYSLDRETATRSSTRLVKLLEELLPDDGVLAADRERLKQAVKIGPGCRKE